MRLRNLILICILILFSSADNLLSQEKERFVNIEKDGALISAKIKNADIENVIKQISYEFDFEYKIFPEMKNKIITASIDKAPLGEVIRSIVRDNYLLQLGNDGKIAKIFIVNRTEKIFEQRNKRIESFLEKHSLSTEELKDVVTKHVVQEHPGAQLFTIIPHEDIKGNLRSYIFSYYIGSGTMPTIEEVKNDINEAWDFKKGAKKHITEAYRNRDSSTMVEWLELSKPYDNKLRRTEEFATFEIAADYDSPPVKKFYAGLPYDLSMYPNALELLEREVQDLNNVSFKRTFVIDLLAIGFEFQNEASKKSYYIDVLNKRVFHNWAEKPIRNKMPQEDNPRRKEILTQWENFLSH